MLEIDLKRRLKAIKHYGERISQAERSVKFAFSETLRNIIVQEISATARKVFSS